MKKSTKVWIGIGVFVMAGGGYTALASVPDLAARASSQDAAAVRDIDAGICSPSQIGRAHV